MVNSTYMEIAGVRFSITCKDSVILQQPGPTYNSFLEKINGNNQDADINILLDLETIPSIENSTKLFDSGHSWSMFLLESNDYLLSFNPPATKDKPVWQAHFNRELKNVTVYCGEKLVTEQNSKTVLSNPVRYPLDQILLMYFLSNNHGALIHAACVNINGKGFIFPGKSGAGKSTITHQLGAMKDIELLNDDRVVVRKINGVFNAYGTPWPGEAGIAENNNTPLSGIFFIKHGSANNIKVLNSKEAIERLLPVTSIPWYDKEVIPKILDFCDDLISNIPKYELQFKPTTEVVDVLETFISL